jgi:hypothetical protein
MFSGISNEIQLFQKFFEDSEFFESTHTWLGVCVGLRIFDFHFEKVRRDF